MRSVNDFFNELNATIESKLVNQKEELLPSLNILRHEALEKMRERTGTADGWAWIAEYMIFHVVRRTVERKLGTQFEVKPLNTKRWKSYVFADPEEKFILGHSVPLKQLLDNESRGFPRRKPDVCLVYRKRIILTIEIKTSVTKPSALQKTLRDLTTIQQWGSQKPLSKAFFVSFGRTLEVTKEAVLDDYRTFYEANGRYVGRFDKRLPDNSLFREIDSRGRTMKMMKLEECLTKIEHILEKLY